jgi:hypothetical protein
MPHSHLSAAVAAALIGAAFAVQPAAAQDTGPSTYVYGTLGYANHGVGGADLGTIQGRIGDKFSRYFGVEGEFGGGVNRDSIGGNESVRINDQEAVYGVGYLPIMPHLDLFARVGVQRTDWDFKGPLDEHSLDTSWNWGAGGQYWLDRHNGVRAEYTRENFDHAPNGDDWSVSYVRKF